MMPFFVSIVCLFGFLFFYACLRFYRRRKPLSLAYAAAWLAPPIAAARELKLLPRLVGENLFAFFFALGIVCVGAVLAFELQRPRPFR